MKRHMPSKWVSFQSAATISARSEFSLHAGYLTAIWATVSQVIAGGICAKTVALAVAGSARWLVSRRNEKNAELPAVRQRPERWVAGEIAREFFTPYSLKKLLISTC